jgi:hypothetical protein
MSELLKVVSFEEKYGDGELGLVALKPFNAGDVIIHEKPLVYIAAALCTEDEEVLKEHKKIWAPKGSHMAWLTKDRKHQLGGESSYIIQMTVRMIMHQPEKSKAIVTEKCQEYQRLRKPEAVAPTAVAYKVFQLKSSKHDEEFWDLANFERLYVHMSYYMFESQLCCTTMSVGAGYCELAGLLNHSCNPNAQVKLIPGKMFIVALADIDKGTEVTISYESMMGFYSPERIKEYNRIKLGFECRCGHCDKPPIPFGYAEGEESKDHGTKASELIRSFCCEPKGESRIATARELFADHPTIFQAGEDNYDITAAHMISAGVLECVHESAGITPSPELADTLLCAAKIMLECTEVNLVCDPIWIIKATFGQLQVAQALLLQGVKHSMLFKQEKEAELKAGKKPTAEELDIDRKFEQEVGENISRHLGGFLTYYLMYKEAMCIAFGYFLGPLVVTVELAMCPSLQSIVLSHHKEINKIQAEVGIDVYRNYKKNLSLERFRKDHSKAGIKKQCKMFLMSKCDRGDECPFEHNQALKDQLYE